jgi:ribosomal protein S6
MENQNYIYQAMFLLDNEEVRGQGFNATRDWVKATLEKHGASVDVLRLWGERSMAYTVGGRKRATYLLGWIHANQETVAAAKREMYLLGPVFRVLFLREDSIPEEELALGIQDSQVSIPDEVEEIEEEEYVDTKAEKAEAKEADKADEADEAKEADGEKASAKDAKVEKSDQPEAAEGEKTAAAKVKETSKEVTKEETKEEASSASESE